MKAIICIIAIAFSLAACNSGAGDNSALTKENDSLKQLLNNTYKPGFGEFMSGIQVHHAKLWFAGINNNWALADFEIHEIMEAIEGIKTYQQERPESKELGMIEPALDSVNTAIENKNPEQFKSSYALLTNTCNNCHKAVHFEFNVVTIPKAEPVVNQDFSNRNK